MKYRELTPAEQEAYEVGYRVGSHQITITDIEWESENEHKIYRKGYWAGYKDRIRNNVHNVHIVHTQSQCPQSPQCQNCNSDNVIVNVIDNETDNVIENNSRKKTSSSSTTRTKQFVPPTLEQVKQYCEQRGNNIDPETFVAFYESKGWKVGSQPMRNWQAAVITWEKRHRNEQAPADLPV